LNLKYYVKIQLVPRSKRSPTRL